MSSSSLCVICEKPFTGYGNNPSPLKEKGRCCNACNILVVISRINQTPKQNKDPDEWSDDELERRLERHFEYESEKDRK